MMLRIVREGSLAIFTLVALLSAPIAHAAPPMTSSPALKDAAKAGLPFVVPGILVGATGGVMLASALGAAAATGVAITVGAIALPVVLLAAGIGLAAWGSWRAYKELSKASPVTQPPGPPGSSPGRTTTPPTGTGTGATPGNGTAPPPPGNSGGGGNGHIGHTLPPERVRPVNLPTLLPTGVVWTGSNVTRNEDTGVARRGGPTDNIPAPDGAGWLRP